MVIPFGCTLYPRSTNSLLYYWTYNTIDRVVINVTSILVRNVCRTWVSSRRVSAGERKGWK